MVADVPGRRATAASRGEDLLSPGLDVFARRGVAELVNLQEEKGQAKPYQVRQVAELVRRYDLSLEERR